MEGKAAVAAVARNGGFSLPPMPSASSHPSRKEWRVVSEQSVRNSSNAELERLKPGQSDERLHGREPVGVDLCSLTIDGDLDNDILQQRLHVVAKQREELLHMEIELRAQVIARSEIVRIQNDLDAQIKEHANANLKLQEQLREKETKIHELERMMEEKERELNAIILDNEAAWAKEDLLREQSKELQSYRSEKDSSEAERTQTIKQIRDLQEHIQGKDRQFVELQEQHRIGQETILFKDDQLREAQTWITRAQEMDALRSSANHTLQAELRERTEHYNQLWLGCQRQFGEMERLCLHIQQLHLELANVREKSGSNLDGSHASRTHVKDACEIVLNNGNQVEMNSSCSGSTGANSASVQYENSESSLGGMISMQADHVHSVAVTPSLVGMHGQVTALHPFLVHQYGVPHPSHVVQSHILSVSAMPSAQSWQNQQGQLHGQHVPNLSQYPEEPEQNLLRMNSCYDHEASGNGHILMPKYVDTNINLGIDADSVVPSANEEGQVLNSIDKSHENSQSPESLRQISSQFHNALRLDPLECGDGTKDEQVSVNGHGVENQMTIMEHSNHDINASLSDTSANDILSENSTDTVSTAYISVSAGQKNNIVGRPGENYLLDERALLASMARAIGPAGGIRISSTLPNRLGKMLAPLHWHDYKKTYGKLDDFVASHPELFLIEGDYIQLREGAQGIIAATAAVAKVAAAAAAPSSYLSLSPSVALTPMAQSHQLRKFSATQHQNPKGRSFHAPGGISDVKIFSEAKDRVELTGSETRQDGHSLLLPVGNETISSEKEFSQIKRVSHGRPGMISVGKQQSREKIWAASSLTR